MNQQFADIMNFQILGPRVFHWIVIIPTIYIVVSIFKDWKGILFGGYDE